jgi:hypothetical protein
MNDDQKWLQAAAGIEQDIAYLKAAVCSGTWDGSVSGLDQEVQYLKMVLAIYKKNATSGVAWPNPDDLFCINPLPYGSQQAMIGMRRDFKTAF